MRLCAIRRRLYYPNQVFVSDDQRRLQYQWLPRRLLLVRHGESIANVHREIYSNTPDWKIPLTDLGREQARNCGKRLKNIIKDEKLYIYYSPYARTRQTLEEIRKSFDESQIQGEREDERLREQEMGNYQPIEEMDRTWAARNDFGRLYYRFPSGESGADVGDRVSGFFDSLLRERIGLMVPSMNERRVLGARKAPGSMEVDKVSQMAGPGNRHGNAFGKPPEDGQHEGGTTSLRVSASRTGERKAGSTAAPSSAATSSHREHASPSTRSDTSSSTPAPASTHAEARDEARKHKVGVLPPNDVGSSSDEDQNVLIVAHGLLIRLFIARWYRVPMEVFDTMRNPPNCSIIKLDRQDDIERLVMTEKSRNLFGSDPLLQMLTYDGQDGAQWYRKTFLGISGGKVSHDKIVAEDDDENHYSNSAAHYRSVGAPDSQLVRHLFERQEASHVPPKFAPREASGVTEPTNKDADAGAGASSADTPK